MTRTTEDYLGLIAPEHAGKPKFAATVALSVDPLARMQVALEGLTTAFDLDTAVGPQLDAVGIRVGRLRDVTYALQGLFFSFDDPIRGWNAGIWKGPYDVGTSIWSLDDETYRRLLRAKVLANRWDGTIAMLEAIYIAYFNDPATLVFVSDDAYSAQPREFLTWDDRSRGWDRGSWIAPGQALDAPSLGSVDMRITVGFAGQIPSIIDLAILDQALVGAKPEGVAVDLLVTSVNGTPLFGFDFGDYPPDDNNFTWDDPTSGWDVGSWFAPGRAPNPPSSPASGYIAGWDTGAWGIPPAAAVGLSTQLAVPGMLDFRFAAESGLLPLL